MNRKITKAKLHPDTKYLEIEFNETIKSERSELPDTVNEIKALYRYEAHPDLVKAYRELVKHLASLCELADISECHNGEVDELPGICNYLTVTKICIGGEDEYEGVTLVGQKKLQTGKVLNLVAPFTVFDSDISDYEYARELRDNVGNAIEEVNHYLKGKRAQLELQLQ